MTKLISGRIAKVTSANVSADRYQFIGLSETEPDLGLPAVAGYVLSSDRSGNRIWVDATSASGVPYFANTSGIANVALTANIANTVLTLTNFTTANLVEGINLYYTNARVISAVTLYLTTANVSESNSNLYYTNARVYSNVIAALAGNITIGNATIGNVSLSGRTTFGAGTGGSLTGANLVSSDNIQTGNLFATSGNILITGNIIPSADSRFNFGSLDKQWKDFYLSAESLYVGGQKLSGNTETGLILVNLTASNITTGNLVVTRSFVGNITGTVSSLSNFTTSNLAEGNNQYFTNARVVSAVTSFLTTSNVVEGTNLYFTNARVTANLTQQSVNVFADVDITGITTNGILIWNGTKFVSGTIDSGTTANIALFANTAGIANVALTANVANTVLSLSNFTTSNLAEGVNLYYTNTRARSAFVAGQNITIEANGRINANVNLEVANLTATISNLTSDSVTEGNQNLYYTNGRVITAVTPYLTTANVKESNSNLYYTNARVLSALTGNVTIGNLVTGTSVSNSYITAGNVTAGNIIANTLLIGSGLGGSLTGLNLISANNIQANTLLIGSGLGGSLTGLNLLSANNIQANSWLGLYTANVIESSSALYYTNTRVNSFVQPYLTTANVTELNNLYYTNARVRSTLSGGTGVSYNSDTGAISIGQNVAATANVTFHNVSITNNLTVYGGVTTYGANNISVSDNMIYLNSNSTVSNPDIGFAFNYNDGVYRHGGFFRDASDNGTFKVFENYSPEPDANIFIDTAHASFRLANIAATTFFGNVTGTVGTLNNFTTANLAEGINLYYTNARVNSNVIAFLPSLAGQNITIAANGQINANTQIISFGLVSQFLTTANVTESNSNLYYTNARVLSAVLPYLTTSNVAEGSNLYYTNARVLSALTGNVVIGNATIGNVIANSAVFGLGMGGSVTGANLISATNIQANSWLGLYTSNVIEGTNLYFTNARVYANIVTLLPTLAGLGIQIQANGQINANAQAISLTTLAPFLTTSNVSEGSNLYYTNARVVSAIIPYLTTSNVVEGSNLYYTNARVVSALTGNITIGNIITTGTAVFGSGIGGSVTGANLLSATTILANTWLGLYTANVVEFNNLYYTNARVISAVLPYLTTSNVSEGSNLYYTNARVLSALTGNVVIGNLVTGTSVSNSYVTSGNVTAGNIIANTLLIGSGLGGSLTGLNLLSANNIQSNIWLGLYTSNVIEGINLYYTNARVNSFIQGNLATKANVTDLTTANVSELTNLYYTNTRVYSNVIALLQTLAGSGITIQANGRISAILDTGLAGLTTSNLAEGVNLYYTNSRVYSNVIALLPTLAGQNINIAANGRISAVIDTENITVSSLSNFTTANLAEGVNLYYTNTRARSAFVAGTGITISAGGIITNTDPPSQFNTRIDGTVGANVLATMSSVITFPTTSANDRFLLRSLHLVNTSGATALVSSNVLYATGNTAYMANAIPVVAGGVLEFIKTHQIFQPGDKINLQGYNTAGVATANLMSVMLTYETFYNDKSYMGTGQTIAASGTNTKIYNSANSFSIIESVKFVNLQPVTVPITCYWGDANGVPKAHLAFGLQLPPNTSVELLQSTKRINQGDALYASYTDGAGNGVSAFVSARYGPAYTIDTFTSSVLPGNTITASFSTSANEGTSLYYTIE